MNPEEKNQDLGEVSGGADEGGETRADGDTFSLKREEYDAFIKDRETLGSLKREYKKLERELSSLRDQDTKSPDRQPEEFGLLQKTYLRSAGITSEEEIELARDIQKRTGIEWDKLPDDEYFQLRLGKLRDAKANAEALSVRGGSAPKSGASALPETYIKRGTPPTATEVPDRKKRAAIARAMIDYTKNGGGKFYNE